MQDPRDPYATPSDSPTTTAPAPPLAAAVESGRGRRRAGGLNPLAWVLMLSGGFFVLFLIVSALLFARGGGSTPKGMGAIMGAGAGVVGLVEIEGAILDSRRAVKRIRELGENAAVKAVVVRVNSPGGAVGPSQEIHEALRELKKPVVASLGSVAASGGYYIAVGARKIFANAGSLTGSIGVIMEFANLEKLYEWARIQRYAIKTGKFKSIGADYRAMSDEERQLLQRLVDEVLGQFVQAVADGRGLPVEQVRAVADGRIFSGSQAKALGLVDELGSLQKAIAEAAKLGGIEGEPRVLRARPDRERLLELLMPGDSEQEGEGANGWVERLRGLLSGQAPRPAGVYWLWSGAN